MKHTEILQKPAVVVALGATVLIYLIWLGINWYHAINAINNTPFF